MISSLFHRATDLRVGHLGVHRHCRPRGLAGAAGRAISGHPAARSRRTGVLSGGQCRDRRADRCGAAGPGNQWRRRHAVPALGERGQRRAGDDRDVRDWHRSGPRRDQRQQSRAGRALHAAGGSAPTGRAGAQALDLVPEDLRARLRRSALRRGLHFELRVAERRRRTAAYSRRGRRADLRLEGLLDPDLAASRRAGEARPDAGRRRRRNPRAERAVRRRTRRPGADGLAASTSRSR